jgi:putative acetyltransferase
VSDRTSSRFNVRPAVEADSEAIIQVHFAAVHTLASAFYPIEVLNSWSRRPDQGRYEQVRQAIANGQELFRVAEDPAGVVGFGSIVPSFEQLKAVYVHPRAARRGVGAAILAQLEQLAISKRCRYLQMDASVNAEAFYVRHDYIIVERGIHRLASGHEMACVKMRKALLR